MKGIKKPRTFAGAYGTKSSHVYVLVDGEWMCWGSNAKKEISNDASQSCPLRPAHEVFNSMAVVKMATGQGHTVIVTADDKMYSWGANNWGQLGLGHTKPSTSSMPQQVTTLEGRGMQWIKCGEVNTYCGLEDGSVYSWGCGANSQSSGDGNSEQRTSPKPFAPFVGARVEWVGMGWNFVFMKDKRTREIYSFGYNYDYQCGLGENTSPMRSAKLVPAFSPVKDLIVAIDGGYEHGVALLSDGRVMSWGKNAYGQAGHGAQSSITEPTFLSEFGKQNPALGIACLKYGTFIVTAQNVYGMGSNTAGQLGLPTSTTTKTPTVIMPSNGLSYLWSGSGYGCAIIDGKLMTCGNGEPGTLKQGDAPAGSGIFEWKEIEDTKGKKVSTRFAGITCWSPANHFLCPPWVQERIICLLMANKRQGTLFNLLPKDVLLYLCTWVWCPTCTSVET